MPHDRKAIVNVLHDIVAAHIGDSTQRGVAAWLGVNEQQWSAYHRGVSPRVATVDAWLAKCRESGIDLPPIGVLLENHHQNADG